MPSEPESSPHVGLAAIAEAAGVSVATVSRVLRERGHASEAIRQRVKDVAARLDYRPNPMVSTLMHQVRQGQVKTYRGTAVFVGATPSRAIWDNNEVAPRFFAGASAEARRLGYDLDLILPSAEGLSPARLAGVLRARGIVGALLAEHTRPTENQGAVLIDEPVLDPKKFSLVLVGHKQVRPSISFAMIDQYANARLSGLILRDRGYQRPMLVLTTFLQGLSEGRFEAGLGSAWAGVPTVALASHDLAETDANICARIRARSREAFMQAMVEHRPDVVIAHDPRVPGWLREADCGFPTRVGCLTLDWNERAPEVAGIDQRHEVVGSLAMRELSEQIERNEKSPLAIAAGRLAEGLWHDGPSLPAK